MCRAFGSSRTREKEPCDRVLSLPCGFHTGGSLPALSQVTLPVHPPHPFTYLAASWKVDVEHAPAPDFTRWYMSRVTCGPLLLEVCRRCKVCPNLVAHLQIPRMRISYQVAMPVVGRPGQHAVLRRPDGAVGKALLSQGWCPQQVLQMPRERSQPLVQEIPLAFRQTPATVLPVASPLLQDHDVVQSLQRCRPMAPAMAASGPQAPATSGT